MTQEYRPNLRTTVFPTFVHCYLGPQRHPYYSENTPPMDGWDKPHKCPDSELSKNGPEVVSQEELGRARRRSHEEPGGARRSQEEPGRAPGKAKKSQGGPGPGESWPLGTYNHMLWVTPPILPCPLNPPRILQVLGSSDWFAFLLEQVVILVKTRPAQSHGPLFLRSTNQSQEVLRGARRSQERQKEPGGSQEELGGARRSQAEP